MMALREHDFFLITGSSVAYTREDPERVILLVFAGIPVDHYNSASTHFV